MNNNIFNSKKDELRIKTNDDLEKRLPLLYKAYDKLLQKADPFNYELCSSFEELAKFLGYKIHEWNCPYKTEHSSTLSISFIYSLGDIIFKPLCG